MQSHLLCHAIRKNDGVKIHHFFSKSYKNGFMLTAPEKLCNNMKYAQAYRCIFRCYCTLTITSAFFLLFSIWKRKKPRSFCKKKIAVVHLQLEFVSLMYIIKCLCMSIVYPTLQSKPSIVFFFPFLSLIMVHAMVLCFMFVDSCVTRKGLHCSCMPLYS